MTGLDPSSPLLDLRPGNIRETSDKHEIPVLSMVLVKEVPSGRKGLGDKDELIGRKMNSTKKGNELTVTTRDAFQENTMADGKISKLIDEIPSASEEQSQGINQVGQAVGEMDRIVQQNTAAPEESAGASEELNVQAAQMKDMVDDLVALVEGLEKGKSLRLMVNPTGEGDLLIA